MIVPKQITAPQFSYLAISAQRDLKCPGHSVNLGAPLSFRSQTLQIAETASCDQLGRDKLVQRLATMRNEALGIELPLWSSGLQNSFGRLVFKKLLTHSQYRLCPQRHQVAVLIEWPRVFFVRPEFRLFKSVVVRFPARDRRYLENLPGSHQRVVENAQTPILVAADGFEFRGRPTQTVLACLKTVLACLQTVLACLKSSLARLQLRYVACTFPRSDGIIDTRLYDTSQIREFLRE